MQWASSARDAKSPCKVSRITLWAFLRPLLRRIAIICSGIAYGIDGLRGALIGLTQFGPILNFGVLAFFASGFLVLGAWALSRI